ncbi:MAG: 23S rRNA (adenine(2503)-C(2))-methyltransferase RlmN [Planctomycetaceae bacterium]|nr:23S rRNA (adenine(2503)-C(2))-methyltransferase RlmN [Planctomycetaceae bacterium]
MVDVKEVVELNLKESKPPSIFGLTLSELEQWCLDNEIKKYRAAQIYRWLYPLRAGSWEEMTDLPLELREKLTAAFSFFVSEIESHQIASDRTEKLLLKLNDGEFVECVIMREPNRSTICISTQVGCAMACVFCASGLAGLTRNLSTVEILEQIVRLDRLMDEQEKITNIVVMGIGEPLANLANLLPALERLHEGKTYNFGTRRVTISTVGLPEKIRELARIGKRYSLAVSLHAPNDKLRTEIVPVNKNIGIKSILEATDDFFEQTGRRVTFEYVLLSGINDSPREAKELAALLRGRNAHVNLIPMNAISLLDIGGSSAETARAFSNLLNEAGIVSTIRKRKGADIDAACGQLRLPKVHDKIQLSK